MSDDQEALWTTRSVLSVLHELVEELRGLRADLAQDRQRPSMTVSHGDRALLVRILPAIGGALGTEVFTTADIYENDSAGLRLVRAGLSPRQFGQLLHRATGTEIDGYTVKRQGVEQGAVLWHLVIVEVRQEGQG